MVHMALGGAEHGDDTGAEEEFPLLVRLLQLAAERGEGTVLGLAPPGRARIGRVSRADADAFAERLAAAYRERSPAMVRYATGRVGDRGRAEDVVQRAFEKILRRQRSNPPEITNMHAYLHTAVCNEINRELREVIPARAVVSIDDHERGGDAHGDGPSSPVDVSTQVTDIAVLRQALEALSPREREAVVIRMQWQLSVTEAAEVMKLSTGAVKRYTSDGLRRLREQLGPAIVA
jgi:RNA polymerase sigma-70 factor (ECF subfamily)